MPDKPQWSVPVVSHPGKAIWAPAKQHIPELIREVRYVGQVRFEDRDIQQYQHVITYRCINIDQTGQMWKIRFSIVSDDIEISRITKREARRDLGA